MERPASVVKELLENSLDAGATELRIEVETGGRRLIRIADNGCGMLRDDALLAFERHATSKLRDVKDLLSIATLGFRGEALPSIASVSRLLLETRSPEETTGTARRNRRRQAAAVRRSRARRRHHHHGPRPVLQRAGAQEVPAVGADRTGAHRFAGHALQPGASGQDVPAAQRRERTAFGDAGGDVARARLPGVRRRDARRAGGFGDARARAAAAARRTCRRPKPSPNSGASRKSPGRRRSGCAGFVSRPQVQKSNRNSIFIFVNGRLIRDRLLLHAISAAYHNLMPPAAFPFALLFLECDCGEVDVNVHPSKTEVRFRHQSFVHDFVRDTHAGAADGDAAGAGVFTRAPPRRRSPPPRLPYSEFSQMIENQAANGADCAAGRRPDGALPEFTLRPAAGARAAARLRHGRDPAFRPAPPSPPLPRGCACPILTAPFPPAPKPCRTHRSRRSPTCGRWARSTRASSSPPGATGCGSSTSTWRTSACSSSRS